MTVPLGRLLTVAIPILAGALLAACSNTDSDPGSDGEASIVAVYGDSDSDQLEVSVDTCNKSPRVEVEETTTEVRLHVVVDGGDSERDDCQDSVKLTLDDPLGTRSVIDDLTDETLELSPSD